VQCSDALYTDLSWASRGQRLGVSSRELVPKLERLQRPAGRTQLFVHAIDNAIAAGLRCLRKEASLLHPTADRQAGRMQEARKPMWCDARLCSPGSGGCSVREAEFALLCSPKKIQMAFNGAWCYE
jgi:hypothetical protein